MAGNRKRCVSAACPRTYACHSKCGHTRVCVPRIHFGTDISVTVYRCRRRHCFALGTRLRPAVASNITVQIHTWLRARCLRSQTQPAPHCCRRYKLHPDEGSQQYCATMAAILWMILHRTVLQSALRAALTFGLNRCTTSV